ncbi:MAG: molybdopterin-dependent oxidoreductase [Candidatus Margulisiibacteriota bacterium]
MVTKRSVCLFCSVGCGIGFKSAGEDITGITYDRENPTNQGSLCPRGYYNLELINSPQRLSKEVSLALIKEKIRNTPSDSLAIFLSATASNEEAHLLAQLAENTQTKNVAILAPTSDLEAYEGKTWDVEKAEIESIAEIESKEALLIIGDALTRSAVLSRRLNKVKYGKRGNQIIVIDPNQSHTTWFATNHLAIKPGMEAVLLSALIKVIAKENNQDNVDLDLENAAKLSGISVEKIITTAKAFNAAPTGTIIFAPSEQMQRNDLTNYFCRILASLSPNKKYLTLYACGNLMGTKIMLDRSLKAGSSIDVIREKIKNRTIKTIIMLGEDLSPAIPEIRQIEFTALSSYFAVDWSPTVLLPLASQFEENGTFTFADGRTESVKNVAPKVGSISNLQILEQVMETHGHLERIISSPAKIETNLNQKIAEAQALSPTKTYPIEIISHFGNNELVKRFFWYRVNNK